MRGGRKRQTIRHTEAGQTWPEGGGGGGEGREREREREEGWADLAAVNAAGLIFQVPVNVGELVPNSS